MDSLKTLSSKIHICTVYVKVHSSKIHVLFYLRGLKILDHKYSAGMQNYIFTNANEKYLISFYLFIIEILFIHELA